MLAAILHRLDPYALGPFDGFGLRWYGLSYVAGFLTGWFILKALTRTGRFLLRPEDVGSLVLTLGVGAVVGGRLGYCLFYQPELLVQFDREFPFWGVLAIHRGGMASHGGMAGLGIAGVWFARSRGLPTLHLLDLAVLAAPPGLFFGRLANFVNGELYGRPAPPGLPWAVKFPQEILDWANRSNPAHARLESAEFARVLELVGHPAPEGALPGTAALQSVLQAVWTDDRVARALEPFLTPRHPSQIYQALLEGPFLFLLLGWIGRRARKPGVLSAWFLLAYGVARIVTEEFRTPDAHLGTGWLGRTRGQWLSMAMLAAGAALLGWSLRRAGPRLGGWLRSGSAGEGEVTARKP